MANRYQVAHRWANKNGKKLTSSTMFFRGDDIYSYGTHFRIATHVTNAKGKPAVLFTERTYSVTTAGHKSVVRSALRGLDLPVFSVPTLDGQPTWHGVTSTEFLTFAFEYHVAIAKAEVAAAKKARTRARIHLQEAQEAVAQAKALSAFFGLKLRVPSVGITPNFIAECATKEAKREAEYQTRRAKEKARWEARDAAAKIADAASKVCSVCDGRFQPLGDTGEAAHVCIDCRRAFAAIRPGQVRSDLEGGWM